MRARTFPPSRARPDGTAQAGCRCDAKDGRSQQARNEATATVSAARRLRMKSGAQPTLETALCRSRLGLISDGSTSQHVQAMAGFGGGAAASLNAVPLGAETSQQRS